MITTWINMFDINKSKLQAKQRRHCTCVILTFKKRFVQSNTISINKHVFSAQYAFFKEPKTWLQAKDICSSCEGELVNWDENISEIVSHNDIENTLVWIGNYTLQYPWLRQKGWYVRCIQVLQTLYPSIREKTKKWHSAVNRCNLSFDYIQNSKAISYLSD